MKALGILVVCGAAGPAHADVARADEAAHAYFAGVVVRTDRNTQSTRVSAGVRTGRLSWTIVADPMGYQTQGEQSDTDAMVEIELVKRWALFAGWRVATTPILGRRYWHHKPFVGVSAPLPSLFWGHVRTRFGAEIAVSAIKHGDELPTMGVWDAMSWDGADDAIDVGIFLRAELARGF